MIKNLTLTATLIGIALSVAQPASTANAKTVFLNPALSEKVVESVELQPVEPKGPKILIPPTISCKAARKVIKDKGYNKVRKLECDGLVYTFKGKMNGKKHVIAINAITKFVWTL